MRRRSKKRNATCSPSDRNEVTDMENLSFASQLEQLRDLVQKTDAFWQDAAAEEYRAVMLGCIREIEQITEEK